MSSSPILSAQAIEAAGVLNLVDQHLAAQSEAQLAQARVTVLRERLEEAIAEFRDRHPHRTHHESGRAAAVPGNVGTAWLTSTERTWLLSADPEGWLDGPPEEARVDEMVGAGVIEVIQRAGYGHAQFLRLSHARKEIGVES